VEECQTRYMLRQKVFSKENTAYRHGMMALLDHADAVGR
jgi:hypothetical protein